MKQLESVSDTVQRAIVVGIVLYFALFFYAEVADVFVVRRAANAVFGFVALGVGAVFLSNARETFSPLGGAGVCLVVGGIAQLVAVVVVDILIDSIASIAVFVGIGLYVYAIWTAS
ncbi:hypothetical protein [Natronosalvus caseinilyticus]|uniref:hypothetical protein n=1 Tax=Natronosalvus caseinilyticus TaxID=2953747 RepID=UPI0028B0C369|nr:hypothetical protein [Natronosalvus caseinilyticus]